MNEEEISELLQDLHNRLQDIESKFNIKSNSEVDRDLLWLKNSRTALGIKDSKVTKNAPEEKS